jgi:hypothetical protein
VEGEDDVVRMVADEGWARGEELEAKDETEHPAKEEEEEGGEKVHDPDPFVVKGIGPGLEASLGQVAPVRDGIFRMRHGQEPFIRKSVFISELRESKVQNLI